MAKRGRPTKDAAKGQRVSLGLKVTAELKRRIEHEGSRSGRTQSQEAERRIDLSFEQQALCAQVLELRFGRPLAALLLTAGEAMQSSLETFGIMAVHAKLAPPMSVHQSDEDWLSDPHAFNETIKAAMIMFERFRPKGDTATPQGMLAVEKELALSDVARFATKPLLAALAGRIAGDNPVTAWADEVRSLTKGSVLTARAP